MSMFLYMSEETYNIEVRSPKAESKNLFFSVIFSVTFRTDGSLHFVLLKCTESVKAQPVFKE